MELHAIPVSHLHYTEAGQFIVNLFENIKKKEIDLEKDPELPRLMNDLRFSLDEYKKALQQIKAREETVELLHLDFLRDRRIGNIRKQVAVYQHTEAEQERKAYPAAKLILNKYKKLEKENYAAETLGIQNMLAEWAKAENQWIVKALDLEKHITNLKDVANAFDLLFTTRSGDQGATETFDAKGIRSNMLKSYKVIAEYTLSMAKTRKDNAFYVSLLNQINEIRKYFSDILAKRDSPE